MIVKYKLKNGITCIFNKIEGVFSVCCGILVKAGSAYETPEENGISHFLEHVNFKGTKKRSAFEISSDIDNLGAQINAFTSKEFTCYYVKSIGEHFAKSFEILSDIFVNSVYDEEELVKERGVVLEEINMYEDTPDEVCSDNLAGCYFGKTGYGATILGPSKNVNGFDRKAVLNYKNKYYTTDNIVISIAGAIDVENAKAVCEKYLGEIAVTKGETPPVINLKNLEQHVSIEKDVQQAHVALAFKGTSLTDREADNYSVACGVLGGGMSSRLFQMVREKMGLCYSVYSYITSYVNCGFTTVYAGVSLNGYQKAFDAIMKEIKELKTKGITQKEFERTREQIKSSFIFTQESTASQMILFGKYLLLTGKIFDIEKRLNDINNLSLKGVNDTIFESFETDKLSTCIVGKNVKRLL